MELRLHILRAESTTVALNWLPTLAVCAAVTAWVVSTGSVVRPMQPRVTVLSGGPAPTCSESGYHQAMRGAVACPGDSLDSKTPRSHLIADGVFAAGRSDKHGMALAAFVGVPSGQIVPPAPPQIPPLAGPRVEPLSPPAPVVPPVAAPPAQHKSPSQTGREGSSPARQQEQSPAPQQEPPSVPPGGTVQLSP